MMVFPRLKTQALLSLLKHPTPHPNVILVEGPRQVGKTTVVLEALKQSGRPYVHLNLEKDLRHRAAIDRCQDFTEFTQWLADALEFRPGPETILFFDEAQESQQLGQFVRSMKEEWEKTSVILTGSMMSRLFRETVRYPVGRVTSLHIQSLSFFEYLRVNGKDEWVGLLGEGDLRMISPERHRMLLETFNRYLHIGGMPEVVSAYLQKQDPTAVLLEIYEGYRRDFMRVFGEDQGFLFERAMQAVADHVGSPSKFTQAVAANESAYKKMASTFSRLEAWHMIYVSAQRSEQPEGTSDLHPKRYLFDLGVLSQLRTLGVPPLSVLETLEAQHRQSLGGIFENAVAFCLTQWGMPFTGWKKGPTGTEIDFIARFGEHTIPIECKASLKLKGTQIQGLRAYMRMYGLERGVAINAAPFQRQDDDAGIIFSIPIYAVESLPALLRREMT